MVLFILAGVWAAVLLPPYLRNRSERPSDSISSFRTQLSTLERAQPGMRPVSSYSSMAPRPVAPMPAPGMPLGRAELRRRRRDILFTLAGAVGITFMLAVALGGLAIMFFLASVALLGGYVYLLVQMRKDSAERAAKVRYIAPLAETPDPALLLHRSASN